MVRQALVELDQPGLLEQVDHGVAVGPERQRAAGRRKAPGRAHAIAEVALVVGHRHTRVPVAPSALMSPSIRWVAWTAVVWGPSTRRPRPARSACDQ